MSACASMNFLKKVSALVSLNAAHEYIRRASLVELATNKDV
jgi:hypothetical protein